MVSIIPKPSKKLPEWHNTSLYVSLGLLILVVLGFSLLVYFESKAVSSLQDLEDRISQVGTKEEKATERQVLTYSRQISDFSALLQSHQKLSRLFSLLEETCHPKVWFSEFIFDSEEGQVELHGITSNFPTLEQQVMIYQNHESIKSIGLNSLSISEEGDTEFALQISFNPEIVQ